ncbi:hybrid sensor histidine kinase/response regulator [Lacunisphaera limnophila]|uniref:hybrid sensor histidine kinase/response regulator n=1 Tax=Lacunisphaera limnophila TaxID=1838286 RepID=UPI00147266AC|nr:PAS domain-containing protein [Lacunisphaera limnophila]
MPTTSLPPLDRTENILRRISQAATLLALGAGMLALAGWWTGLAGLTRLRADWPPLLPANALGLVLAATALLLQWTQRPGHALASNVMGGLILLGGLSGFFCEYLGLGAAWQGGAASLLTGGAAQGVVHQPGVTNNAMLILAGLGLLQIERTRRIWLSPSALFGAILLALALFSLMTRLAVSPDAAPGISGLGALGAVCLGLALVTIHFNSGFVLALKADNATGLVGRRLLILAGILPPALYLLQLRVETATPTDGLEQLAFTTVAFTFVLLAVLVLSLRRLERLDQDKTRTEQERDRLLHRVQHQAASLQQEVSMRTRELKLLNDRHRLALRSSSYGVWDWDVIAGEQVWDGTMLAIFGLQGAGFSGKHEDWLNRIHPDDQPRIRQIDWNALEPEENLIFEYRIVRPDGNVRQLRAQGQPQFSPEGRLLRVVGLARDQTREKEREVEMDSLTERLQFVITAAGYGVWEYDFKADRLYWDEHLLKLHGLERSDVSGGIEAWRQRVHPEDWPEVQHHLNEVIAGRRDQFEPEYRIILPGGSARYMQMRSYLIRQPDGTPGRLVGLNRDVTAARELREQLRISEERWRLIVTSNNDAVWDWDLQRQRVYRDQRYAEMVGLDPTQLAAQPEEWSARVHPEDLPVAHAAMQQHLEGRSPYYQCELRMRHRDGHWIWMLDRGKVVARDDHGQPLRLVGTQTDITTRKVLEEKLRHNEQLSLQLNRLAQIGAWEEDTASGRLTWAPEVYRIHEVDLGFTPTAETIRAFFSPEAATVLDEAFARAREDGTPFDLELPFTTARGRPLWIRILGQAETQLGRVTRLFGGFQDITARRDAEEMRRQLESQLFQAQKMETLGTLAGGIAHDFNNLLTGILGYQDLAFDGLAEDHESRPYLEASREASLRARELVDQILTFSRQSGAKKVTVELKAIVEDARRFLRATVPATIRIEVSAADDCAPVLADASQIHQVLLNLGSNAAHAMHQTGGLMRITLSPATVAESSSFNQLAPGQYVRLDFSDSGHGMDETTCKRIFDPFFTTKEVGQGTGLGLSMVHGIIQAHQGAISVESVIGQGTTFTFFLPVAEAQETPVRNASADMPRGRGELVAIVDDEDLVRSFAQISLERAGYRVVAFDRASACLEEIRGRIGDFAVLLTDQTMPGMNGMELVTEIRNLAPSLPVIIMSGYYSRIAPEMLQQMGYVSLISKPFTNEELAHAVHRSVSGSAAPG